MSSITFFNSTRIELIFINLSSLFIYLSTNLQYPLSEFPRTDTSPDGFWQESFLDMHLLLPIKACILFQRFTDYLYILKPECRFFHLALLQQNQFLFYTAHLHKLHSLFLTVQSLQGFLIFFQSLDSCYQVLHF